MAAMSPPMVPPGGEWYNSPATATSTVPLGGVGGGSGLEEQVAIASLERVLSNGMKNVQDPVREALSAALEVVKVQSRELAKATSTIAKLTETVSALEVEGNEMKASLAKKADVDAALAKVRVETVSQKEMQSMRSDRRYEVNSLEKRIEDLETGSEAAAAGLDDHIRETKSSVEQVLKRLSDKASKQEMGMMMPRTEAATRGELVDLDARVARKVEQEAFEAGLARKVTWSEIEKLLLEKADVASIARLELQKMDGSLGETLACRLDACVGKEEVRTLLEECIAGLREMEPKLKVLLIEKEAEAESRARGLPTATVVRSDVKDLVLECMEDEKAKKGMLLENGQREVTQRQLQSALRHHKVALERGVDFMISKGRGDIVVQCEGALKDLREELCDSLERFQAQLESHRTNLEMSKGELVSVLNKKAYKVDVAKALREKADSSSIAHLKSQLETKVSEASLREALSRLEESVASVSSSALANGVETRADIEKINGRLRQKVTRDQIPALVVSALNAERDIGLKAQNSSSSGAEELGSVVRKEDVQAMVRIAMREKGLVTEKHLEARVAAEVAELDRRTREQRPPSAPAGESRLADLACDLARVTSKVDEVGVMASRVEVLESDVVRLTQRLGTVVGAGRWLWRSGVVHRGGWVPWEVQMTNTAPDCFLWEKNTVTLTASNPGLYLLSLAFFTNLSFTAVVMVNGEPVISLSDDGDSFDRHHHSIGDVTSRSVTNYIALPSRSKVAVRFESTARAQAFLSLQKL